MIDGMAIDGVAWWNGGEINDWWSDGEMIDGVVAKWLMEWWRNGWWSMIDKYWWNGINKKRF